MYGSAIVAYQQAAPPEDRGFFTETQGARINALRVPVKNGLNHRAIVWSGDQHDPARTRLQDIADKLYITVDRPKTGQHGLLDVPAASWSQCNQLLFGAHPVLLDKCFQKTVFPLRKVVMTFLITGRHSKTP